MQRLTIKGTSNTPYIELDPNGTLSIRGRSTPENPLDYYAPVTSWVGNYIVHPKEDTTVRLFFIYINTSSLKCLIEILKKLLHVTKSGNKLTIEWLYEEGDDDMRELGAEFEELLQISFSIIPVNEEQ
jgi:hypothetical protein